MHPGRSATLAANINHRSKTPDENRTLVALRAAHSSVHPALSSLMLEGSTDRADVPFGASPLVPHQRFNRDRTYPAHPNEGWLDLPTVWSMRETTSGSLDRQWSQAGRVVMSVGWREGFPPLPTSRDDKDGERAKHHSLQGHDGLLFADEDDTDQTDADQLHIVHGRATLVADPAHGQSLRLTPATVTATTTTNRYQAARATLGLDDGPHRLDLVEHAHARLAWASETFGDRDAVMKLQPRL